MEPIPSYDQAVANLPGQTNYAAGLATSVQNLAPLATSYHGTPAPVPYAAPTPVSSSSQSGESKFLGFFSSIGKEIGDLGVKAGDFVYHSGESMTKAIPEYATGIVHGQFDREALSNINTQRNQYSDQLDTLNRLWKAGGISTKDYKSQLDEISQNLDNLDSQANAVNGRLSSDYHTAIAGLAGTSADLLTVLTAGFGKFATTEASASGLTEAVGAGARTQAAGDWLLSQASHLSPVEDFIAKAAASENTVIARIGANTMAHIEQATADVVATGARMTSEQIARASAANLAIKYPITFAIAQPTAKTFYNDMANKKYGQAVLSLGYTAALITSGGAIPYALEFGGAGLKKLGTATFGETSFWDEYSKFLAGNSGESIRNAVADKVEGMSAADRQETIKNLSAVEAINVAKTGGDPVAAARLLADAQRTRYGFDVSDISAKEEVDNMLNDAKWRREADAWGKANDKIVILGRTDARSLKGIADTVSSGDTIDKRLGLWEGWKADNPMHAASNNSNFDKQMKSIIQNTEGAKKTRSLITSIESGFTPKGFPKALAKAMSKDGVVPIVGDANADSIFREGTGVIKSKFAQPGDIWTQTVKPAPILGNIGQALTGIGLSPQASAQQVYGEFTAILRNNLKDTDVVPKVPGQNPLQATDSLLKQLSNYMQKQTRTGAFNRTSIQDLRQMTVKDIQAATGLNEEKAKLLQMAIAKAHIQVPLAIKGLGEKAVDLALYGSRGQAFLARRFQRLQSALRFSMNPFFQYLRVIPKNEILTESKGGGYLRAIANGRVKEMNQTRDMLRKAGFFSKVPGHLGNVITGEATDYLGSVSAISSLVPKTLLPMQEKSISALIDTFAQRSGLETQEYIDTHAQDIRDTIQAISAYPLKKSFLNSPLARTLNIAIFPFRFEAKVGGAMAQALAHAGLLPRVAFIKGLTQAHDFLNSPQGKTWYQQNADVIGLIKYITPLGTLNEVFNSLLPGHDHSIGNFGELGGLPFGWIPQLLDNEGLTNFNGVGINPQTGQPYAKYIPADQRAQLAVGLQTFLEQVFTYPGATIGLPSKTKIVSGLSEGIVGANSKRDFTTSNGSMTDPSQINYPQNAQTSPVPGTSVPAATPTAPPVLSKPSSSSTKKKKAQFTPQLLPGQTSLGTI